MVKLWIIAETVSAVDYFYHGLYRLSWPLPAVFFHRCLPWCSRPHPLLRWHLCSPQFLGFLCLLRTPHYLPQPGVLDLLVSGKPGCANGITPQMRFTASSFAIQSSYLAACAGKWDRVKGTRANLNILKNYTNKTCCEVKDFPLTKLCSFVCRGIS